ncbi:hypothetical protein OEZ85_006165 [Tetradesmus obliquus]|uniref:Patatin n=1 Tax=Tetradesmus obliquus TaxID=3088 RepID=A0ABY8UFS4_TETOB|nr:hypothetical protein OEZ85_006165 [Tetradesmus obliquus]
MPVHVSSAATAAGLDQDASCKTSGSAKLHLSFGHQPQPRRAPSGSGSSSAAAAAAAFPKYEYLVFGGGGARCFGYAGALHALRQLGLLGRLRGVSGSSGGAVYALLAALRFSVPEVQAAMGTLPETETLSWLRLNSRLGLSDGEATFRQIEAAISAKLGVPHPSLADVAAAAGCPITLTATSLARRAPVYLSSATHPDMPVRDALRASCAIPFFFTPLRGPEGDLLVDGCISDCAPLAGLKAGGAAWEPQRTLVLAVADAGGLDSPDFQGLLGALLSTCMQAGLHHTAAAGIDLLNLWPAVAGVNPLQFRMGAEQARDVIASSQALAEEFAVNKMKQFEAAAAIASAAAISRPWQQQQQQQQLSSNSSGRSSSRAEAGQRDLGAHATSVLAGMGSGSSGAAIAAHVLDSHHDMLLASGLHQLYPHPSEQQQLAQAGQAAAGGDDASDHGVDVPVLPHRIITMEGSHQALRGMALRGLDSCEDGDGTAAAAAADDGTGADVSGSPGHSSSSSGSSSARRGGRGGISSLASLEVSEEDWDEADLQGFRGVEVEGEDDDEAPAAAWRQRQQQQQQQQQATSRLPRTDMGSSLLAAVGFGGQGALAAGAAGGAAAAAAGRMFDSVQDRWLARLAVERLLRAAGLPEAVVAAAAAAAAVAGQAANGDGVGAGSDGAAAATAPGHAPEQPGGSSSRGGRSSVLGSHLSDADWQLVQAILEHQELLLQQQEQQQQQQQQQQDAATKEAAAAAASAASCDSDESDGEGGSCGVEPLGLVVRECGGISQLCMATGSLADEGEGGEGAPVAAALASADGRDWGWPLSLSTWDESTLHG